jgi:hypothetical protein
LSIEDVVKTTDFFKYNTAENTKYTKLDLFSKQ